ncbi:MAG: helix-turn-helix transcriptional regulator [Sporolactobacillus sp.]|nr:helix-turn-helix transcriptional regulator [Sporolactobacillus sp.]
MKQFTMNEWQILNSIIYNIYTTNDFTQMRKKLLQQLKLLIDFDCGNFYLASKDNPYLLENPVSIDIGADFTQKYLETYNEVDYSTGIMFSGNSLIYRESDILPEKDRVKTDYYQMFYVAYNLHYSLHFAISKESRFLGIISLFRKKGKADFDVNDIMVFELLQHHLEYRMFHRLSIIKKVKNKITVHEAALQFHLTRREETILSLLLLSMTNQDICDKLCIANNTLKKHILNIYKKLGINHRIQIFQMLKNNAPSL